MIGHIPRHDVNYYRPYAAGTGAPNLLTLVRSIESDEGHMSPFPAAALALIVCVPSAWTRVQFQP
jgi:hypothetical protein